MSNKDISVIIPVYNDPQGIRDTLNSLLDQDFKGEYEILPVDNNSSDSTASVIDKYEEKSNLIKGLEERNIQSSYAARNEGIRNSKGDIICFLDADMWVKRDYLSKVYSYFEKRANVDYIGCKVEIVNDYDSLTGHFNEKDGFPVEDYINNKNFSPTCCLSLRKEIFGEIGYFNQNLISGGDKAFGKRVSNSRFKMRYVEDITVYHPARGKIRDFIGKYFRIGRGKYQKRIRGLKKVEDSKKNLYIKKRLKAIFWKVQDIMENRKNLEWRIKIIFFLFFVIKRGSMLAGYQYERLRKILEDLNA